MIRPKLMVVENSREILNAEGLATKRFIDLILLSREASSVLEGMRRSREDETYIEDVLEFARNPENSLDYMGVGNTGLRHVPTHEVNPGLSYAVGDVLTEAHAFGFGYRRPLIDTQVTTMAWLVCSLFNGDLGYPNEGHDRQAFGIEKISELLRRYNQLEEQQVAFLQLHPRGNNFLFDIGDETIASKELYKMDVGIHHPMRMQIYRQVREHEPIRVDAEIFTGNIDAGTGGEVVTFNTHFYYAP